MVTIESPAEVAGEVLVMRGSPNCECGLAKAGRLVTETLPRGLPHSVKMDCFGALGKLCGFGL